MLNAFFGGRASTADYLWADSLCRTNPLSLEWGSLIAGGWIFGVFVEKRDCPRGKRRFLVAAETFSLFLVLEIPFCFLTWFCPARGGAGGCSGPVSVKVKVFMPGFEQNTQRKCCRAMGCVRGRGKVCQEQREIPLALAVIRLELKFQPVPGSVVISFPRARAGFEARLFILAFSAAWEFCAGGDTGDGFYY